MPRLLTLLILPLLACACGREPPPEPAPAATAAVAAEDGQGARQRPPRGDGRRQALAERLQQGRDAGRDWWADEAIATPLGLTPAQREAIGREVADLRAASAGAGEAAAQALARYREALRQGDLEAARAAAGEHAAQVREQSLQRYLLPVAVLEPLQPGQRAQLVAEHPELLAALVRGSRARRERADSAAD